MTTPQEIMGRDAYEAFLATLDPAVAKTVRTAAETQTVRYPLASEGLTRLLDGGIVAGAVTTCYGNTSAGKSALFMESIGRLWQPQGLVCAYADVEGTYKKEWGARLGIDNESLIYVKSRSSGRLEKEIRPYLEKGVDILVIDSISDLMPEVFFDKAGNLNEQDGRKQTGAHAKAITNLINGIHYINENTAVVLISQTTTFIGQTYVEQVPHGGKKTEFGSSVMIRLTSSNSAKAPIMGTVKRGDRLVEEPVGREVNAYLKKNKTGVPFRECNYNFYYQGDFVGIDRTAELVDYALELGVIEGSKWFSFGDQKWQGKANTVAAIKADAGLEEAIRKEVYTRETGEILE
jgi:RecA/RadA recombinase